MRESVGERGKKGERKGRKEGREDSTCTIKEPSLVSCCAQLSSQWAELRCLRRTRSDLE